MEAERWVGALLPESLKVAIVRSRAPEKLRDFLEIKAIDYGEKYIAFHDMIASYLQARGSRFRCQR